MIYVCDKCGKGLKPDSFWYDPYVHRHGKCK